MSTETATGATLAAGVPEIEGWFTTGAEPHLLGTRCASCRTYFFPREDQACRNPTCDSTDLDEVELSRTGKIWSYTDAAYQPPEPFVAAQPFEPFGIAAVELTAEQMVVMGQLVDGVGPDDVSTGDEVELVIDTLFTDDEGVNHLVWKWRPTGAEASSAGTSGGSSDR